VTKINVLKNGKRREKIRGEEMRPKHLSTFLFFFILKKINFIISRVTHSGP
jgi:hypothetical protein